MDISAESWFPRSQACLYILHEKKFQLNIEVTGRKENSPLLFLISSTELFKQKVIPVLAGLGNC